MIERKDRIKKITIIIIALIIASYLAFSEIEPLREKQAECAYSEVNKYSNKSSSDFTYAYGNCYVEVGYYKKGNVLCSGGFLGIFKECKKVKDYNKYYEKEICFSLETGELC